MIIYQQNAERAELAIAQLKEKRNTRAALLEEFKKLVTEITPNPPVFEDLVSLLPTPPEFEDLSQYTSLAHLLETIDQARKEKVLGNFLSLYLQKTGTSFPLAPGRTLLEVMEVPANVRRAYEIALEITKIERPERYLSKDKDSYTFTPPPVTDQERDAICQREKRYIANSNLLSAIHLAEGYVELINLRTSKEKRQTPAGDILPGFEKAVAVFFEKPDQAAGVSNPPLYRVNYDYFFLNNPERSYSAPDERDLEFALPTSGQILQARQNRLNDQAREKSSQYSRVHHK